MTESKGIPIDIMEVCEDMTGKEVVSLIQKLEAEGMTAEKIIEIIKYVETAEPKKETQ